MYIMRIECFIESVNENFLKVHVVNGFFRGVVLGLGTFFVL